jgi:hypothetical protein
VDIKGTPAIAEVKYFFRLQFSNTVYTLALVSVFSPSDQEILKLSNHAAYICHHSRTDAFTVVDVKAITAVMLMVSDYQVMVNGDISLSQIIHLLL